MQIMKNEKNPLYEHVIKEKGDTASQFCDKTGIEYSTAIKLLYTKNRIPQIQNFKLICKAYPDMSPNRLYRFNDW